MGAELGPSFDGEAQIEDVRKQAAKEDDRK
jgi:hypothetical protein